MKNFFNLTMNLLIERLKSIQNNISKFRFFRAYALFHSTTNVSGIFIWLSLWKYAEHTSKPITDFSKCETSVSRILIDPICHVGHSNQNFRNSGSINEYSRSKYSFKIRSNRSMLLIHYYFKNCGINERTILRYITNPKLPQNTTARASPTPVQISITLTQPKSHHPTNLITRAHTHARTHMHPKS